MRLGFKTHRLVIVAALWAGAGLAPVTAFAGPYDEAVKAYERENYAAALPLFQSLAEDGNDDAQFYLGQMHALGAGTAQSDERAVYWYTRAAKAGDETAQYNLAVMYDMGRGVEVDYKESFKWYLKSAKQGDADAAFEVGKAYRYGNGTPASDKKALTWFEASAAQGHYGAMTELGLMYDLGAGVETDYQRARELYSEAAENGDVDAKAYLAELYESGDGVAKDLEKALALYQDAAGQGSEYAIKALPGIEAKSAAKAKDAAAFQKRMAELAQYQAEQRAEEAAKDAQFKKVAAAEPIEKGWAAYDAGDYQSAFRILHAHAHQNNVEAQTRVGLMYRDGKGVAPSDEMAGRWFEKAEKGHSGEAYYHHAMLEFWDRYSGACCLTAQGLMDRSYRLGYQPAIDRQNAKDAAAQEELALQRQRDQEAADAAARRAEYLRKNPPRTITNCDGPRPGDAPPIPAGYFCDRRPGSPTYGDYVSKR